VIVVFGFGSESYICSIIEYAKIHFRVLNMAKRLKLQAPIKHLFENVLEEIKLANKKLDSLVDLNEKILMQIMQQRNIPAENVPVKEARPIPNSMSLLMLPMSLRKTVMVLYKLEKATAEGLAKETGRLRAVESSAANQLVRMGYLSKKREGRDVYFFIDAYLESRE
jgi:hypothetical protein